MKVSQKISKVSHFDGDVSLGHWDTALKGNVPMSQSQNCGTNCQRVSQSMGGPEGPPDINAGATLAVTGRLRPLASARQSRPKSKVFDAWLAGATAEQQAAWESGKKPGKP